LVSRSEIYEAWVDSSLFRDLTQILQREATRRTICLRDSLLLHVRSTFENRADFVVSKTLPRPFLRKDLLLFFVAQSKLLSPICRRA
jgi:hypothetical protein